MHGHKHADMSTHYAKTRTQLQIQQMTMATSQQTTNTYSMIILYSFPKTNCWTLHIVFT